MIILQCGVIFSQVECFQTISIHSIQKALLFLEAPKRTKEMT